MVVFSLKRGRQGKLIVGLGQGSGLGIDGVCDGDPR